MTQYSIFRYGILLLIGWGYAQDFDMIQEHLDKMEDKIFGYGLVSFSVDENGDTTFVYKAKIVVCPTDTTQTYEDWLLSKLKSEFWGIYKEEYLRYVAKEMLEVQFEPKWISLEELDAQFADSMEVWFAPVDTLGEK